MNHTKNLSMHRGLLRTVAILMMLFMLVPLTSGLANAAEPTLSEGYMTVSAAAGTRTVTVKNATGTITASSDAPGWLSCTVSGNKVTVRFQQNQYAAKRSGTITVKVGTRKLFIFVYQVRNLVVKEKVSGNKLTQYSYDGYPASKVITLEAVGAGTITASKNRDWISVSVSSGKVNISVKPNYTSGPRDGRVTISDGYNKFEFAVFQKKFTPALHGTGFLFSVKAVPNSFKNAYKAVKAWKSPSDFNEAQFRNLIDETLAYLGYPDQASAPEWAIGNENALAAEYGDSVRGLYSGYDSAHNLVIVNFDNANTGALIAKAVIHELRHYWQKRYGKYNSSYTEYIIMYGNVYYTNADDTTQIAEVDAYTFTDKVIALLNK